MAKSGGGVTAWQKLFAFYIDANGTLWNSSIDNKHYN